MKFYRIYTSKFLDGMVATEVKPINPVNSYNTTLYVKDSFLELNKPLELVLHDYHLFENAEGWEPRFGDMHEWVMDRPDVHHILVSEALKELLVNFSKPEHKWYDANVSFEDKNKKYFLLCLKNNLLEELDFSRTTFSLHKGLRIRAKEIKVFGQGEVPSLDEYIRMNGDFLKNRQALRIKQSYYNKNYDLFWGVGNLMIISEKLKIAIEEVGFEPFGVVPIPEGQIIMAGT